MRPTFRKCLTAAIISAGVVLTTAGSAAAISPTGILFRWYK